jgi:phage shock protein C
LRNAVKISNPMAFLRDLSKSSTDVVIGGVCGGLGKYTPIPPWMWRAAFLVALLFFGTGGLFYVILWIALPDEKPSPAPPPDQAPPAS